MQFVGYEDTWDTKWGSIVGWSITGLCIVPIPLYMVYILCASGKGIGQLIRPTPEWVPNRPEEKEEITLAVVSGKVRATLHSVSWMGSRRPFQVAPMEKEGMMVDKATQNVKTVDKATQKGGSHQHRSHHHRERSHHPHHKSHHRDD